MDNKSVIINSFWCDDVNELSVTARLLFFGLLCFSDAECKFPNRYRIIKLKIFPADLISRRKIIESLDSLYDKKLITLRDGFLFINMSFFE